MAENLYNETLFSLKEVELDSDDVQVYVIKRKEHQQKDPDTKKLLKYYTYHPFILQTDKNIRNTLFKAVSNQIKNWDDVIEYKLWNQDIGYETALGLTASNTDLLGIIKEIEYLNEKQDEERIISDEKQLTGMWMYIVRISSIQSNSGELLSPIYAVRRVSNTWTVKKSSKNSRNATMKNATLVDIGDDIVFNVDRVIDFLSYNDTIFVHYKKNFEVLMNLKISMLQMKEEVVADFKMLKLIDNEELFSEIIGSKQLPLQKIAHIYQNGYYKDKERMDKLIDKTRVEEGWFLEFTEDGKINLEKYKDRPDLAICMLRELNSEKKQDVIDGTFCYAGVTSEIPNTKSE